MIPQCETVFTAGSMNKQVFQLSGLNNIEEGTNMPLHEILQHPFQNFIVGSLNDNTYSFGHYMLDSLNVRL